MRKRIPVWIGVFTAAGALVGGSARAAEPAAKQAEQAQALQTEVKELRKEIEARKAAKAAAPAVVPAPAPGTQAAAQAAEALEERVQALEVQHKDSVVVGDLPGSYRVPGTDVSIRLYGFAEMNYIHDLGGDNSDIDYSTFAPYMPLDGSAARQR